MRRTVLWVVGVVVLLSAFGWQQSQLAAFEDRVAEAEADADGAVADLEWDIGQVEAAVRTLEESVARVDDHEAVIDQMISDLYELNDRVESAMSYAISAEDMAYRLARIIGAR